MRHIANGDGTVTSVGLQDGSLFFGTTQDQTAIAEEAKTLHREGHHGSKDMRLAARVGLVEVEKYINEQGITFAEFSGSQEHIRRFLMDPDRSDFRVWKGKL